MKKNRLLQTLVLALFCGLVAGGLSLRMLRSASAAESQPGPQTTVQILVATRDLAPGDLIGDADLRRTDWPRASLPRGYATDAGALLGKVLTAPVGEGQPVLEGAVAAAGVGLPAVIPAGMRAVSLRIDDVSGVAGFVSPGSKVDVLVTLERRSDQDEAATRTVLQAVQVAAVGREMAPSADGAAVEATVATLLVSPEGAEKLVLAANRGKVQLALRGSRDRREVRTSGAHSGSLVGTVPASAPLSQLGRAGARSVPAAAPAQGRTVEVLNGSRRTVVAF